MIEKSKKLDRLKAMQSLNNQLKKHYTKLADGSSSTEITLILIEIIKTYQKFAWVLEIIESSSGGQGNPGDFNLLELSKKTFLELEKKLNRIPRQIEFKNEMKNKTGLSNDKNLERIYKKLTSEEYWLFEEIKKTLLINK